MNIKPILTEADYRTALARVEKLMETAKKGTLEGTELEILGALVANYERENIKLGSTITMEVCRKIVDNYYRRRTGSEEYVVRLEVGPNPLDFDGDDEVSAHVVRKSSKGMSKGNGPPMVETMIETVVLSTESCDSVEEALDKLTKNLPK